MAELHVDKLSVNRNKHAGDSDFLTADMTASKFQPGNTVTGFTLYDQAGTFTFIVPAGVTKLSALCIGAGGGGYYNWAGNGGGGGGLAGGLGDLGGDGCIYAAPWRATYHCSSL